MGWFNSNKDNKSNPKIDWVDLTELEELNNIVEMSKTQPVLILKHSTRCSISIMAKRALDTHWDIDNSDLKTYYLDLLKYRPISNQIAETFNVHHQSPQVLIIKDGICSYSATHSDIDARAIKQQL
jgi:bacillithiol system protein YtxJ